MSPFVKKEISIEPLQEIDYEAVKEIVLEAFREKFLCFIDLDDASMLALFDTLGLVPREPFLDASSHLVAKEGNTVLAYLCLQTKNSPTSPSLNVLKLFKDYGFFKALKLIGALCVLEQEVKDKEAYVEMLAVKNEARGMGIGTKLLLHAQDFVEQNPNLHYLSLHVLGTNPKAISLYKHFGFLVKEHSQSTLFLWLLKSENLFYMRKQVSS